MISTIDINILEFIQRNLHSPFLDKLMPIITSLGNAGLLWIAIGIVLTLKKEYRETGILVLGAVIINTILGEGIIKNVVRRGRPFIDITTVKLLIAKPLSYSFPSGHTGASFAAASVLSKYFKKYRVVFYIMAFLIAFSRLYLFVHFPSDVVAGIILGLISAKITLYLNNRRMA